MTNALLILCGFLSGVGISGLVARCLAKKRASLHAKELASVEDKAWCNGYFKAASVYAPSKKARDKKAALRQNPH
jgi:hypothetical protein